MQNETPSTTNENFVERVYAACPLVIFSVYTDIQCTVIRKLGQSILAALDQGIREEDGKTSVDGEMFNRVYGDFWLWVLGAFEIVRTMEGAKECFSPRLQDELRTFKRKIVFLRSPFTKQMLAGARTKIRAEPSIADIEHSPPNMIFSVESQRFSVRDLCTHFEAMIASIRREDVLFDFRDHERK